MEPMLCLYWEDITVSESQIDFLQILALTDELN